MICCFFFFFQAEDGIRDLVRSRGLGDVYKRQGQVQNLVVKAYARDPSDFFMDLSLQSGVNIIFSLSLIHI